MDPDWQLASWLYCSTQGGSPGLKAKPTGLIPEFISIDHRSSSARGLGRHSRMSESEGFDKRWRRTRSCQFLESRSRSFGNSNSTSTSNGQQRRQQWSGRGAKGEGQRGRGRGQWRNPQATADEEKEPDAGKGKGKKGKSGKAGGKANGKPGGKRKRDGKGDADPKPAKKKKDDVTCYNCGETGHYRKRVQEAAADHERRRRRGVTLPRPCCRRERAV